MSLSKSNIEKLCMTGIYHCDPVKEWRSPVYKNDLYWCCNWNFKVRKNSDGTYDMVDTYWSGGGGLIVELTDENFDMFKFLFDMNDVQTIYPPDFNDYDEKDRWHLALDSGGYRFSKHYYVRKGAKKNKDIQIERLQRELDSLKWQVKSKEEEIKRVMKGE